MKRREFAPFALLGGTLVFLGSCTVASSSDVVVDAVVETQPYSRIAVEREAQSGPTESVRAEDVTIVDDDASLDLSAEGIPLKAADIPEEPGYASIPVGDGRYYFFTGEILKNSDGGTNWFVKVPAEAEAKLRDTSIFHMVDANGTYTQKYVLWGYMDENGDTTYLLYDPELGPECPGGCEEIVGTPEGRFIAIAPGD